MCISRRWLFRLILTLPLVSLLIVILIIFIGEDMTGFEDEGGWFYIEEEGPVRKHEPVFLPPENDTKYPIIVWWTPFTAHTRLLKRCSEGTCLFTHSRTEYKNPNTVAFLYYGSDLDWNDLPLPRKPNHLWALMHEESPKNNWIFAHEKGIGLFNLTATCSRYSNYPLVTQYLDNLQKLTQPIRVPTAEKSTGDLGLVMYVQSDCDPPSDRDTYVEELMKYVKVDSYGKCLHNKDLPEHLVDSMTFDSQDLYNIQAKYKFTVAFENAICHDYITEKLWRPLYVGSVPIVRGSPTVQDWAPSKEHSIIVADDFDSPKELADYLLFLDKHDEEYEKYLKFKENGVTNSLLLDHMKKREWRVDYHDEGIDFIDGFECFVCNEIHKRLKLASEGKDVPDIMANKKHYDCPMPEPSVELEGETIREKLAKMKDHAREEMEYWRYVARCSERKAAALSEVIGRGGTQEEVSEALNEACHGLNFFG